MVAASLITWFKDSHNKKVLDDLLKQVHVPSYKPSAISYKLSGKTFVLTGTLAGISRDEAKAKIKALGGNISSAVSSKTSYVVVGENPGEKLTEAEKLEIPTLSEEAFVKLINS